MNPKAQLRQAYVKRLNTLTKNFFKDKNSGLNIFIEHLKFKRDILVLDTTAEHALATLIAAVAEFEAYQTSEDIKQKEFHWNSFCNFVKSSMEDWQTLNDSV